MKRTIISFAIICVFTSFAFAYKLDNFSRATLNSRQAYKSCETPAGTRSLSSAESATEYYNLVVEINDDSAIEQLKEVGSVIFYHRANFLLVAIPKDAINVIYNSSFTGIAALSRPNACTTDVARSFANVNAVHAGSDGSFSFSGLDGSGVVTGICDIGFEPSHIAFRNRLAMKSTYIGNSAYRSVYAPGSSLRTTDDFPGSDSTDDSHGTHTTNILAGGRDNNPYYGVAPASTLAVSTSSLSDMALLCGIEDIIAYAKEIGQPAVINLSVGSYLGPHDGTDIVNRYLELLGKEAIICFSAGNYGQQTYCLQHDFSADNPTIGSMIENSRTWLGFDIQGYMDFWGNDNRSFEMQFVAYDKLEKKFIYEGEWFAGDEYGSFSLKNGEDEAWDAAFTDSYIYAAWGVDDNNNRYNLTIAYQINPTETISDSDSNARYVCGWRIRGQEGAHLDAYSDGAYSTFRRHSVPNMQPGNSLCSISNLCCNHSVLSVGACNSRNSVPVYDGTVLNYSFTKGNVASWSSYGSLIDGRSLPLICAPGNMIVSAVGPEYYETHPTDYTISYQTTVDGKTYRWIPRCGTSMASPVAAGIIALWLQADPTLTIDQVIDIAQRTAIDNYSDITDARWGAGCIDAYAGLKYILTNNGVANVSDDDDALITVEGHRIISTAPLRIYDTLGRTYPTNQDLSPGLYIASTPRLSKKIIIR